MTSGKIYYWPDGSWMWEKDYEWEVEKWRGDDYGTMFIDMAAGSTEEEVDAGITKLIEVVNNFDW